MITTEKYCLNIENLEIFKISTINQYNISFIRNKKLKLKTK